MLNLSALGPLRFPFIAAAGAIYVLSVLYFTDSASPNETPSALLVAFIVASLCAVVLYALMRTALERNKSS